MGSIMNGLLNTMANLFFRPCSLTHSIILLTRKLFPHIYIVIAKFDVDDYGNLDGILTTTKIFVFETTCCFYTRTFTFGCQFALWVIGQSF